MVCKCLKCFEINFFSLYPLNTLLEARRREDTISTCTKKLHYQEYELQKKVQNNSELERLHFMREFYGKHDTVVYRLLEDSKRIRSEDNWRHNLTISRQAAEQNGPILAVCVCIYIYLGNYKLKQFRHFISVLANKLRLSGAPTIECAEIALRGNNAM